MNQTFRIVDENFNFFVFKKNEKLYLCVDYKSLNVVIVKNKYLLSLITKTLNCFNKFKRFTKFNLKNIYY